jgi:hypothetical protein
MTEPLTGPAAAPTDALLRDPQGRPAYFHRPKLIGPETVFTLEDRDLAWSNGRSSGRLPLHQIDSVRIVFRPANLYTQRYRVEIRQRLGRKLWFSNISYRGMAQVEAHDPAFTAFVRTLLPAIAKASPKARFLGGEPAWRYGAVAVITLALVGALLLVGTEALRARSWPAIAVAGMIGAYVAWLMGQWLVRNRPVEIDPANPLEQLLPGGRLMPPRE